MIPICDVHCHILPGVDDGCKDLSETLQVLQDARKQGIYDLIATPHYYHAKEEIQSFLHRRNAAYESLKPHIPVDMRIGLGAEVAFFSGISHCEELDRLCLGNSRYLLLELPFVPWSSSLQRELQNLVYIRGITPVLAHIERYIPIQTTRALQQVLELDTLVQMNAEHLLRFRTGFQGRRLLKNGTVQLLGSDCHNTSTRAYNLGDGVARLEKHKMFAPLRDVADLSLEIFEKAYTRD